MRRLIVVALWISTLAVAYALGRHAAPGPEPLRLSDVQMEQRVTQALDQKDQFEGTLLLSRALNGLSQENLPGAVRAFDAGIDSARESEIQLLMYAWARIDPMGAFEHARGWSRPKRGHALPALALAWGQRKPMEAAVVVADIQDDTREAVISGLVNGWASSGLSGVEDFIAQLPPDGLRNRLTATLVADRLRERGIDPVTKWVEELPEGKHHDFKHTAFLRAANQIAELDAIRASTWVDAHIAKGYAAGAAEQVSRKWIPRDADAAFAWLAKLESAEERDFAVFAGFRRWLNTEHDAAVRWLTDTQRTAIHDWAIVLIARELKSQAPAEAVAWSERIQNRELRIGSLAEVIRYWGARDKAAATAWLSASEFAPEIRAELKARRGLPRPSSPASRVPMDTSGRP